MELSHNWFLYFFLVPYFFFLVNLFYYITIFYSFRVTKNLLNNIVNTSILWAFVFKVLFKVAMPGVYFGFFKKNSFPAVSDYCSFEIPMTIKIRSKQSQDTVPLKQRPGRALHHKTKVWHFLLVFQDPVSHSQQEPCWEYYFHVYAQLRS
jgi:hypothetical protein